MLDVCAEYAAEFGFTFAPEKCEVLAADPEVDVRLPALPGPRPAAHSEWPTTRLAHKAHFKYLGAMFAYQGLDPVAHAGARAHQANLATLSLVNMGCNGGGYGPRLARQLFLQVVLPTLTYACHLAPMTVRALDILEKAQHQALTRLRSLPRSTSKVGARFYYDVLSVADVLAVRAAGTLRRTVLASLALPRDPHVAAAALGAWNAEKDRRGPARWGLRRPLIAPAEVAPHPSDGEHAFLDGELTRLSLQSAAPVAATPPRTPDPAANRQQQRRAPPRNLGSKKGGASFFDGAAATPVLFAAACAVEPGSRTSALAYDQAVRAWRNGRQDDELSANVEKPAFALLAGSAGEQMRSLHEVGQRRVRRAIERLLLAPWGGAPTTCRGCGAAVQLSAQHLEACGGTLFIAGIREGDWATVGPTICAALVRCRGDAAALYAVPAVQAPRAQREEVVLPAGTLI
jgi:hypothetical protein